MSESKLREWARELLKKLPANDAPFDDIRAAGEFLVRRCAEIAGEEDYEAHHAILREFGLGK